MSNRMAQNIPIHELLSALTDMLSRGNKYVSVMVDEDLILRLRGSKTIKDIKTEKQESPKGFPHLPKGARLEDFL